MYWVVFICTLHLIVIVNNLYDHDMYDLDNHDLKESDF